MRSKSLAFSSNSLSNSFGCYNYNSAYDTGSNDMTMSFWLKADPSPTSSPVIIDHSQFISISATLTIVTGFAIYRSGTNADNRIVFSAYSG